MEVDKKVIEQYKRICKTSAFKCADDDEIAYKIERAVTLGKVVDIRDGDYHKQYHNIIFIIKDNKINSMYQSNSEDRYIVVSERVKKKYDLIHSKALV